MRQKESPAKVKQLKGRVQQATGIITGDSALERKGAQQRVVGAVEEGLGKARRKVGEALEGVAKAIKK
jgi:uncharacterized protein YjbJ (UPF0337 family)